MCGIPLHSLSRVRVECRSMGARYQTPTGLWYSSVDHRYCCARSTCSSMRSSLISANTLHICKGKYNYRLKKSFAITLVNFRYVIHVFFSLRVSRLHIAGSYVLSRLVLWHSTGMPTNQPAPPVLYINISVCAEYFIKINQARVKIPPLAFSRNAINVAFHFARMPAYSVL